VSEGSVEHATFVVERTYPASPERVFAAWSDLEVKKRWYSDPEAHLDLDFRIGGREHGSGSAPDGRAFRYEARFHDIVPPRRIVYAYEMFIDGTRISVSLATVAFESADDGGTRMTFTEQGAFLDGHEVPAQRTEGMGSLLDALAAELQA